METRAVKTIVRRSLCLLAAFLPSALAIVLYRLILGYKIGKSVNLGFVFFDCRHLEIGDGSRLGHGTVFWRCGEVRMGEHANVGSFNLFRGGKVIELGSYSQILRLNVLNAIPEHDAITNPESSFYLGHGAVVTAEHKIDFTDRVSIGQCSILGGRASSIWTHNRRDTHPVSIGEFCYVGSEIRMAPGSGIADCCMVGLGSVITKRFVNSFRLIAGVPARERRPLTEADLPLLFEKTRADLPHQRFPEYQWHPLAEEHAVTSHEPQSAD